MKSSPPNFFASEKSIEMVTPNRGPFRPLSSSRLAPPERDCRTQRAGSVPLSKRGAFIVTAPLHAPHFSKKRGRAHDNTLVHNLTFVAPFTSLENTLSRQHSSKCGLSPLLFTSRLEPQITQLNTCFIILRFFQHSSIFGRTKYAAFFTG